MTRAAKTGLRRRAESGFTEPSFARIGELAQLHAGLVFPANRQPSAEAGMRRAMSALRISEPTALLRAFETPGDTRDAVLAELTVGESYFFRDAAQLDLLSQEILPARREGYGPNRPLRIWSAGCASGEEAHTLAIMLRERQWPHPARILGTDIALPRLAAARRGRYTRWALRGVAAERITQWFAHTGTHYDLDPTVRAMVEFRPLNLVSDAYATPERGTAGFDLVLCRNVMIYFEMDTVAHIARGLLDSLSPDGWLLLGASDPMLTHLVDCEVVVTTAGIAYRRAGRAGVTAAGVGVSVPHVARHYPASAVSVPHALAPTEEHNTPPAVASSPADVSFNALPGTHHATTGAHHSHVAASAASAYAAADYPAAEALAMAALPAASTEAHALSMWIIGIRSVANQGRLNEAGELCARALELHPLSAELQYLHATLLTEAGWFSDAVAASRRAIYLDREFVMGHMLLGDTLARVGDTAGAHNAFTNALHLLANADVETVVTAADGVPVTRLRQVAELRLRTLAPRRPA